MGKNIRGFYPSRKVFFNNIEIDPKDSQCIINHSPDGFNWGYGGSGAAQLALGILNYLYGEERAAKAYQAFKWDIIAGLEQEKDFELPISLVVEWINNYEKTHS
jgi:hypothetical protein